MARSLVYKRIPQTRILHTFGSFGLCHLEFGLWAFGTEVKLGQHVKVAGLSCRFQDLDALGLGITQLAQKSKNPEMSFARVVKSFADLRSNCKSASNLHSS